MSWLSKFRKPERSASTPAFGPDQRERLTKLVAQRRYREVIDVLDEMNVAGGDEADLIAVLGRACLRIGQARRALSAFEQASALAPGGYDIALGLAEALLVLGDASAALARADAALDRNPGDVPLLRILAVALHRLGNSTAAADILQRVVAAHPDDAAAWDLLGMALLALRGPEAALQSFAEADRRHRASPDDNAPSSYNHAITLAQIGRVEQALTEFEEYLADSPEPYAFFTYAMALIRSGHFREGWRYYEFRWMTREFIPARPNFDFPPWLGQDLQGRRVLLLSEQGYGDTIQFIRYAKLVSQRGARVFVASKRDIIELLLTSPGVDESSDAFNDSLQPDYYAHLMSLPRIFGTTLETVPSEVPYLSAPDEACERWRRRFAGPSRKIGLAWLGNPGHALDRFRSIELDALSALVAATDVRFFCLHKAPPSHEQRELMSQLGIVDLSGELTSFSETAAAISALDLVISVDTSVAHLAGALGKSVWLMVSKHVDFRWMDHRVTSPWYPTMRIIRQLPAETWREVLGRVAAMLGSSCSSVSDSTDHGEVLPPYRAVPRLADTVVTRCGTLAYLVDDGEQGRSLAEYGEWRSFALEVILANTNTEAFVLDVHPGVGIHSVAIGKALRGKGHLMVVENRPVHRRLLTRNLETNGLHECTVLHADFTDSPVDDLQLARLGMVNLGPEIDVTRFLDGASATLWRLRPWVLAHQGPSADWVATLRDMGYRLRSFKAPLFNPHNYFRRTEDIFRGAFFSGTVAVPEEVDPGSIAGCVDVV